MLLAAGTAIPRRTLAIRAAIASIFPAVALI
jgi:hypothetical protein